MFEGLAHEIDELEIGLDGAALAAAIALRDRLDARISAAVGEFDAADMWSLTGEGSMRGWLKAHAAMSNMRAAAMSKTARTLRQLPVTRAMWQNGELSSGQVDAIVAHLDPLTLPLFAEHEPAVVPELVGLTVGETVMAMIDWRNAADALVDRPEPPSPEGKLSVVRTLGDRRAVKGDLDPHDGQLLETALRVAMTKDADGEPPRSWGQKLNDALIVISKFYLDNQSTQPGGSHRPHLNVVVTKEDLEAGRGGTYADGTYIDGVTLSTLACDCVVHRVLVDAKSAKIDFGTETRTINADLRTVLVIRDRGCRFPGCDRPATHCDGHHVHWWRHGGRTSLDNLALFCRAHHRTLHKPGWRAVLDDDGTLHITDPAGETRVTRPPAFERLRPTG